VPTHVGVRGGLNSKDGVSQEQEDDPLSIPQFNFLYGDSIVWGEDVSNTVVTVMSSHHRVTLQILSHCQSSRVLKLKFVVSRLTDQLSLRSHQCITLSLR
jgi:hypothetical protein